MVQDCSAANLNHRFFVINLESKTPEIYDIYRKSLKMWHQGIFKAVKLFRDIK